MTDLLLLKVFVYLKTTDIDNHNDINLFVSDIKFLCKSNNANSKNVD